MNKANKKEASDIQARIKILQMQIIGLINDEELAYYNMPESLQRVESYKRYTQLNKRALDDAYWNLENAYYLLEHVKESKR